jgi:CRP/FNR family cyclic AMP-dependent transcriptional regulator
VLTIHEDAWQPPHYDPDRTYGLLILDGLLGRRVMLGGAATIELLGPGDIVRPWQKLPDTPIPARVQWRPLSALRMAVLDERVTTLICGRPDLTIAFAGRLTRRCHAATRLAAIGHISRVEDRLLATLWQLAGNWGRVTALGVRIPVRLTHEVLGELVGAKRPSVTIGLSNLRRQGEVTQDADGNYILTGTPPVWQPDG